MKFARYLQDTQTPEWKKAYIDYRGLKKQIGLIRAQAPVPLDTFNLFGATDVPSNHKKSHRDDEAKRPDSLIVQNQASRRMSFPWVPSVDSLKFDIPDLSAERLPSFGRPRAHSRNRPSLSLTLSGLPQRLSGSSSNAPSQQTPLPPRTPRSPPVFPFFKDSGTPNPAALHHILPHLPAVHVKFFELLDAEIEKIESFYAEREKEMYERGKRLREQLNELRIHREKFYESTAQSKSQGWVKKAHISLLAALLSLTGSGCCAETDAADKNGILASESGRGGQVNISILVTPAAEPIKLEESEHAAAEVRIFSPMSDSTSSGSAKPPKRGATTSPRLFVAPKHALDPQEYQYAKKRLKKAIVEHYRGLEVLNNYRILNFTGFRKALKKYEKITKIPVQAAYMKERVEPAAFASGAMVSTMLKEMEEIFATRFERGDKKKAINRLRVGSSLQSQHFSTFRSGLWLGLAVPAVVAGSYMSFRGETRRELPTWECLLFIYSILVIPVLFALLIGINLLVWARERINYPFIFELDLRSRLDHREYFELPSFLLCALAYAFCFSFTGIGPPLLWPLVWLALVLLVMFNPIRSIMWGRARWWTIKNVAKLGASGVWKVEFTDFWLGDQFTSLSYTFSNLYFVGCFYTRFSHTIPLLSAAPSPAVSTSSFSPFPLFLPFNVSTPGEAFAAQGLVDDLTSSAYDSYVREAQEAWITCGAAQNWGWYFALGALPFLIRFMQSLRRYRDSKLPTHLINAGKYGMGMTYYFFYYYWRHKGDVDNGSSYILWCFAATVYAIYACTWDFLMDWSMCKPHARHPFLRPELVYTSQIPAYYFALVSNVCIRFLWVFYIPSRGPEITWRTFVAAMLEMLRRIQWNFFRLENEHLGNMDQYRVTRELPLPYSIDTRSDGDGDEEDHDDDIKGTAAWFGGHAGVGKE